MDNNIRTQIASSRTKQFEESQTLNDIAGVGTVMGDLVTARSKTDLKEFISQLKKAFEKADTERNGEN